MSEQERSFISRADKMSNSLGEIRRDLREASENFRKARIEIEAVPRIFAITMTICLFAAIGIGVIFAVSRGFI